MSENLNKWVALALRAPCGEQNSNIFRTEIYISSHKQSSYVKYILDIQSPGQQVQRPFLFEK